MSPFGSRTPSPGCAAAGRGNIRRAFTLTELIVVLGIVAALIAILLPALTQAREAGRQASCFESERQIAMAVHAYLSDFDETFPQTHPTPTNPGDFGDAETTLLALWRDLLQPYIKAPALFRCPSDTGFGEAHDSSYAPNGYTCYGITLASLAHPDASIYLAELADGSLVDDLAPWQGMAGLRSDIAATRHRSGANYLFGDGHARWLRYEDTWSPAPLWAL